MKNFLVLYCATPEAFASWKDMTEEDRQKEMKLWEEWLNNLGERVVDPGNPAGKNTRVTKSTVEPTPNAVCGYGIFAGESVEEMQTLLQESPHLT